MGCSDKRFFGNMIPITGGIPGQKDIELIAGEGIQIMDLSTASKYKFEFSTTDVLQLTVALDLIAKELGVVKTNPVLKGTIIDVVELDWVYNKIITSQELTNDGALSEPVLGPSVISHDYSAQSIDEDITITIEGDDGSGLNSGQASDSKSILFGNYMWIGDGASKINSATSAIEAFLESLTSTIKTSRVHSYFATGGVNEKHFVAYPKSFGLATFTKGIFNGGYIRLKNVSGTLKSELGMGDIESDVIITNSKGYAEAYYIYESLYDNQEDAATPFIIS